MGLLLLFLQCFPWCFIKWTTCEQQILMFPTLIKIYHNLVGFSTLHPESTTSSEMQRWNQKNTLSHITIDESHRLHKNGGFNFRPPCAELCCLSRLKCLLVALYYKDRGSSLVVSHPERNWRQKWRRLLLCKPWSCTSFSCQLGEC